MSIHPRVAPAQAGGHFIAGRRHAARSSVEVDSAHADQPLASLALMACLDAKTILPTEAPDDIARTQICSGCAKGRR